MKMKSPSHLAVSPECCSGLRVSIWLASRQNCWMQSKCPGLRGTLPLCLFQNTLSFLKE